MLAHRQRDRATRALDLIGELHPGGRGADHQRPARRQLPGMVIIKRREALDALRNRLAQLGYTRDVGGAAGEHDAATADFALIGCHPITAIDTPD